MNQILQYISIETDEGKGDEKWKKRNITTKCEAVGVFYWKSNITKVFSREVFQESMNRRGIIKQPYRVVYVKLKI